MSLMSTFLGRSSELYYIDPRDILPLPDAAGLSTASVSDEIAVLIAAGEEDKLLSGKILAEQAVAAGQEYIPVRFWFKPRIPLWNLPAIFIKPLRQKYKFTNSRNYHASLPHLRELKIERGTRNAENAYKISKRWHISEEERHNRYNRLVESLKKGFDDNSPIRVMLCRRLGIKDSIDDGHHRIGICVVQCINRITLCFRADGAMPAFWQKLLRRFL